MLFCLDDMVFQNLKHRVIMKKTIIKDKNYQGDGASLGNSEGNVSGSFSLNGRPCGSAGKESACNAGYLCSIPGLGKFLEKGKATYSSTLAWTIPWTV